MATQAPNSNDILNNARFSASSSSSSNRYDDAPTAASILSASIDPSALHPLAGLVDNNNLDYLLLEDDKISGVQGGKSVLPSRGWGDELCYGTGSTYLAGKFKFSSPLIFGIELTYVNPTLGLAAGGVWGFREGLRKPLMPRAATPASTLAATTTPLASTSTPPASTIGSQATAFASAAKSAVNPTGENAEKAKINAQTAAKVSGRLRWNNVLNQVTRRGSFTGNSAGVLGRFDLFSSYCSNTELLTSIFFLFSNSLNLQWFQFNIRFLQRWKA